MANTARNILIWTYERGTLPYDILCGLILAFIFFVPRSCFAPKNPEMQIKSQSSETTFVTGSEASAPARVQSAKTRN